MLKIGLSEISITPDRPVLLRGQFYRRISQYIESSILANTIVIESENDQLILVSCDLVGITWPLTQRVRELAAKMGNGIDPMKIVLAATHTHSAPEFEPEGSNTSKSGLHSASQFLPEGKYLAEDPIPPEVMLPPEALEFLAERIAEGLCKAWEKRDSAYYAPQFGRAVVGHCRRVHYLNGEGVMYGNVEREDFDALEGGNDSGIELLYIFDKNKKPVGALVNIACPSQVVMHSLYISSDYWGKVRAYVKEALGDDFVILGLCSPAGDQCPDDMIRIKKKMEPHISGTRSDPEGTVEIGKRVAPVIIEKLNYTADRMVNDAPFCHIVKNITLPLRKVTEEQWKTAREKFDAVVASIDRDAYTYNDMAKLHVLGGTLLRWEEQKTRDDFDVEIHAARLGNLAYASNPFELFLNFGNKIRAHSPADQTFMSQLSVGSPYGGGYLPTQIAADGGGYSGYVSSGKTAQAGGDKLVEEIVGIFKELFND